MPDPNLTTFYIVRHGESQWNVERRIQGHTNESGLTEKGKLQVSEAAKKLQKITFDLVFSSDLLRTKQTAEILVLEHKLAVISTKALREKNFGKLQGETYDAVNAHNELFAKMSEQKRNEYTNSLEIEPDEEVVSRIITFFRETAIAFPGKTILAVTHGGVMRRLLVHLGFARNEELKRGAVTNSAIVKLKTDGVDFFIEETHGVNKNYEGDGPE